MSITKTIRYVLVCVAAVVMLCILVSCSSSENKNTITSIDDLAGKRVGVQTGTLYEDALLEMCPTAEIDYYTVPLDMVAGLEQQRLDAYLIEDITYEIQKVNFPWMKVLNEPVQKTQVAAGIGNTEYAKKLKEQLDDFIAEIKKSGEYDEMNDYWITNFDANHCIVDREGITGENGELHVVVETGFEPFSYFGNGELQGYYIDFVYRFCREYGYDPIIHEVEYDAIAAGLESGRFDIGMNIIVSDERAESVMFSDIYKELDIKVAVRGNETEEESFIASVKDSFYGTFIKEHRWEMFVEGVGITLLIVILSILLGSFLGFAIYLICENSNRLVNKCNSLISWIVHGTPTVLLLMILYYIVFGNIHISGLWVSIVGFTLMFGYAVYEMIEGSVLTVGVNQLQAARALGYTKRQAFHNVIWPQAVRHIFPRFKNEIVTLIKETAIVGYIAVEDLTRMSDLVRHRTYEAFFPLITTAIIYFVLIWLLIIIVKKIDTKTTPRNRSIENIAKGIKIKEF